MVDSTLDSHRVLITAKDGINCHRVAIHQLEGGHLEFRDIVSREAFTGYTVDTDSLGVGACGKATCIFEQRSHALVLLHFISHRALDITGNVDNALVRTNHDDIVVGQTDITRELTIEDIVVDIDRGDLTTTTEDLDIAQGTEAVSTIGDVDGMEHRGKSREGVGTGSNHLTHHIDRDRTGLTDSHPDLGTAIALAQGFLDLGIGCIHRETTDMNGAIACHHDGTIGGYLELLRLLRGTIDIDEHLVARTYHITGGRGNVHIGLERDFFLIENIAAEHFLTVDGVVLSINQDLLTVGDLIAGRGGCHSLLVNGITSRVG